MATGARRDVCVLMQEGDWSPKRLREIQDGVWIFGADNPDDPALIHARSEEARRTGHAERALTRRPE
jgi:hypothetical protein